MRKRLILPFLVVIFLAIIPIAAFVSAADFFVRITPDVQSITAEEKAAFNVTIDNNMATEEIFRLYTLDYPLWSIETRPFANPILLSVPAASSASKEILIDPLHITLEGTYLVNVKVKIDRLEQALTSPVKVYVGTKKQSSYVPTVTTKLLLQDEIDPRNELQLKIELKNQNIVNISRIVIKIESSFLNKELTGQLEPKESKTIELKELIDPLTKPGSAEISLRLLIDNQDIIVPIVKKVEIKPYVQIAKEEKTTKRLLKTINEVTFTNKGNARYEGSLKYETGFFRGLFTSTKPKAERATKPYALVWNIPLEPAQSAKVTVSVNYRYLVLLIILIVIAVFLYYSYRSPLIIRKAAAEIEKKEEGISTLKVVLHVKNRSKAPLKNIELIDKIPDIAHVEKELALGTLQPMKIIRHEKKGSILKWLIDHLEPEDERVISYRIRSKLAILGEFTLPNAIARFTVNGRPYTIHSNRVTLTS